ncbi:hypothetical protein [Aneurinibacillus terranovensis]|uniref:hypothetical protein n=1 Tax=Aneurinibacillus terranovensis TaxID=278991 RepID=UPI00042091C5|nr:hypothetical protein [Aneurinibacillus terranovensis]
MIKKKVSGTKRETISANQNLVSIEESIRDIEFSLQTILEKVEGLERIQESIEEIKQHTVPTKVQDKKRPAAFPRIAHNRRKEPEIRQPAVSEPVPTPAPTPNPAPDSRSNTESNEELTAQLNNLLQNPTVQSFLKKNGSQKDLTNLLKNLDLSKVSKLLQATQEKGTSMKKKSSSLNSSDGIDLKTIMELMKNPMIQSMIKKVL